MVGGVFSLEVNLLKTVKNTQSHAAVIVADRYIAPLASTVVPETALNKWLSRGGNRLVQAGSLTINDAPSRLTVPAPEAVTFSLPNTPDVEEEVPAFTNLDNAVEAALVEADSVVEVAEEVAEKIAEEAPEEVEDKTAGRRRRGR